MVSGIELTPREKEYIRQNKESKFPSQIAVELGEKFEPLNGGYRSKETVRKALKELD